MTPQTLTFDEIGSESVPPTSVIIVSLGRPEHLRRAVLSLLQQDHPMLELVVVADADGLEALSAVPERLLIKTEEFDTPNIAEARNIGLSLAAGDVVAFMDDDAVAEPTWARRLSAPFLASDVSAAAGFTRGRNGVSWQWTASQVDRFGRETPLDVPLDRVTMLAPPTDSAIKTPGTNAAFRRTVFDAQRGFDPRYRYFLDETDLNLRMAQAGAKTAIVPMAQVLHGFAANRTRRTDRAPTDLFEIGASVACFAESHASEDAATVIARFRTEQRRRAAGHLISGALEPRDIRRLLASFDHGVAEGKSRSGRLGILAKPPEFVQCVQPETMSDHALVPCRPWTYAKARDSALQHVQSKGGATILCVGPGLRRHRVFFNDSGIWEHVGGRFGRVNRSQKPVIWARFRQYVAIQARRIAENRAPLPPERRSVTRVS